MAATQRDIQDHVAWRCGLQTSRPGFGLKKELVLQHSQEEIDDANRKAFFFDDHCVVNPVNPARPVKRDCCHIAHNGLCCEDELLAKCNNFAFNLHTTVKTHWKLGRDDLPIVIQMAHDGHATETHLLTDIVGKGDTQTLIQLVEETPGILEPALTEDGAVQVSFSQLVAKRVIRNAANAREIVPMLVARITVVQLETHNVRSASGKIGFRYAETVDTVEVSLQARHQPRSKKKGAAEASLPFGLSFDDHNGQESAGELNADAEETSESDGAYDLERDARSEHTASSGDDSADDLVEPSHVGVLDIDKAPTDRGVCICCREKVEKEAARIVFKASRSYFPRFAHLACAPNLPHTAETAKSSVETVTRLLAAAENSSRRAALAELLDTLALSRRFGPHLGSSSWPRGQDP